ncbi:MAG: hypothetical protein E7589_00490 [Ruminococcaceae bacterium]|nr:hypothetical protein [Oscillospiraceae bacterium]
MCAHREPTVAVKSVACPDMNVTPEHSALITTAVEGRFGRNPPLYGCLYSKAREVTLRKEDGKKSGTAKAITP